MCECEHELHTIRIRHDKHTKNIKTAQRSWTQHPHFMYRRDRSRSPLSRCTVRSHRLCFYIFSRLISLPLTLSLCVVKIKGLNGKLFDLFRHDVAGEWRVCMRAVCHMNGTRKSFGGTNNGSNHQNHTRTARSTPHITIYYIRRNNRN